jgi:hypothetical protein
MCSSILDSIVAGLIIYGVAALFVISGKAEYIWLGSLLFAIGSMQFVDAIIWFFKQNDISTEFITRYGVITVLLAELLVAYGGYVYYYGQKARIPIYEILLALTVIIYGIIWITMCKETTVTKDGYLKWCNVEFIAFLKITFLAMLLFPMLFFPNLLQKVVLFTLIGGTWLYNFNHEAFGSRWCYSSVVYSIAGLLIFLFRS